MNEQEYIKVINICRDLLDKGYVDAVKEILKTETKRYAPPSATPINNSRDAREY